MTDIVNLSQRRYIAAKDSTCVTVADVLREALRRIDAGEWVIRSVIVCGLEVDDVDESTAITCMHGGPDTSNERIGMLFRAQQMLLP